jgi:hypothetical protein
MTQRALGIPPTHKFWKTHDWGIVTYWRGGAVKVHSGEHGLTWVSVEWRDGRWSCFGPMESVQFRADLRSLYGGDLVSFLSKRAVGGGTTPAAGGIISGSLAGLPALLEYLSSGNYPDGAPRLRSTLLVLVEDGGVKVCLSDRDQEQSLWRSGSSLEDALLALEATLTSEHQDWRRSGGGGGVKPPQRKK